MTRGLYHLVLAIIFIFCVSNASAQGTASTLFTKLKDKVYQIRVIDKASGNKSSIGSGFQISADGYLATNFHVVSDTIHEPEKYRLEYVFHNGAVGNAELTGIDVIHDLAIIKIEPPTENSFSFNLKPLAKGDRIYSMGNPHDLGMTIIEGNYNGLIDTSRYHKILFSGSLNAGMSGGPAFDGDGNVIGINVSKGSEQLSFLVPVVELDRLLKNTIASGKPEIFEKEIERLLLKDQAIFFDELLKTDWEMNSLAELNLPGKISPSLKCWGHTDDKYDSRFKAVHKHCQSQDQLYIHSNFYTGALTYDYEWIYTTELNRFQFYHYLEERFKHSYLNNVSSKEDVSNYECKTDFIHISQHSWRASTCIRAYHKYDDLYDAILLLASVDLNDKAIIIKTSATGISKKNIHLLFKKFMDSIEWEQ